MNDQTSLLLESALELPEEERAALLDGLFGSFGSLHDQSSDAARVAEAESRIDAHDAGKLKSISEDEAYARLGLES